MGLKIRGSIPSSVFLIGHNDQTGSKSSVLDTGRSFVAGTKELECAADLHQMSKLRMSGVIPLPTISLHGVHRDIFSCTFLPDTSVQLKETLCRQDIVEITDI